jgi:SAM-dependent methyltransferase
VSGAALARFATEYARHRAQEGRALSQADLLALPYLREGRFAGQWAVRARTFESFRRRVVRPLAAKAARPLTIVDLGAGAGWLSFRLAGDGHTAIAVDLRDDDIDGLGAAARLEALAPQRMSRLKAPFDAVPMAAAAADIAVFNASLHYALDLEAALAEAARLTRSGGVVAILDSPFYRREADGAAMVTEKKAAAPRLFGARAEALMAPAFIEFLTVDRLARASLRLGLRWRRLRVVYPPAYEFRPLMAALRGARPPSRFDVWIGARP